MGIATGTAVAIGAGALIGGIAGSQKDKSSSSSRSGIDMIPESELEKYGGQLTNDNLKALEGMVNAGPGLDSIGASNRATEDLASMLGDFAKSGGAPSQQDWLNANEFAKNQFKPQEVGLNQLFEQEQMRANQMAAQMGRPVNDPYIQAQLAKQRMQSYDMLNAQKGAFIGQDARGSAMQRLGFTSQLADVRGSLASQAMANRQALLSLGQGVQSSERNWRLGTGTRWGNQETESGGGLKGTLTGGLAGAGMMMGGMAGMGKAGILGSKPSGNWRNDFGDLPAGFEDAEEWDGYSTGFGAGGSSGAGRGRGTRFGPRTPDTTDINHRRYGW
jgi:hypothetical protein